MLKAVLLLETLSVNGPSEKPSTLHLHQRKQPFKDNKAKKKRKRKKSNMHRPKAHRHSLAGGLRGVLTLLGTYSSWEPHGGDTEQATEKEQSSPSSQYTTHQDHP